MASNMNVQIKVEADSKDAVRDLNKVEKELNDLGKETEKSTKKSKQASKQARETTGQFKKQTSGVKLLAEAIKGLAFGKLTSDFIRANASVATFERALDKVAPTAVAAAEANAFIAEEADRLGLATAGARESFLGLYAAGKKNLELNEIQDVFSGVAGAMSALGRSSLETDAVIQQLQQSLSSGVVQWEELQIVAERLPGSLDIFAESMGVSVKELRKMMEGGQVLAKDTLPAFGRALSEAYGIGNERVETFGANTQRLTNTYNQLLTEVGQMGPWDAISGALATVTGYIKDSREGINAFFAALQNMGAGFGRIVDRIKAGFKVVAGAATLDMDKIEAGLADLDRAEEAYAATVAATNERLIEKNNKLRDVAETAPQAAAAVQGAMEKAEVSTTTATIAVKRLEDKLKDVKAVTEDEVISAFEALGIQSAHAFQLMAEEARENYETIKASGLATSAELIEASKAVQAAEEQANRAAIMGAAAVVESKDEVVRASGRVASASEDAGRRAAAALLSAAEAAGRLAAAVDDATTKLSSGFDRGGIYEGGGGTSIDDIAARIEAAGGEEALADFQAALAAYTQHGGGLRTSGTFGFQNYLDATQRIGERILSNYETDDTGAQASTTASTRIVFNDAGVDREIAVTGAADSFLSLLERAATRSVGGIGISTG